MEALAAVGLASNVLQFIDVGYKVLSASKEMYGAGNEMSRSNKDIESISREMKRLSLDLSSHVPTSQPTEDEQALLRLTTECERWSDDMLALLSRLGNRNPNSKFEALRAAWRNHKMQHERNRLERGLDAWRKQLDIQLTSMSRSDMLEKFESLNTSVTLTNDDLAIIKRNVDSLQQSLQAHEINISSESLAALRNILRISDQALLQSKQGVFLSALRYEEMNGRFNHVEPAHKRTFTWLLEEQHGDDSTPLRKVFKEETRRTFTQWLKNDNGIFHISGKPGAGKSTLMKFLCKNELTRRYLEHWANGKTLVFAKSFFWRLGSDRQKSLSGLIRSLLHGVLSAAPDLIPVAFTSRWARAGSYGNDSIQLELDETEQALDTLLMNEMIFEKYKMVFFIDGLDEYQGRHSELVEKFFTWTSTNRENLKICVSSREWNEFMVGFAECPKLHIHECTHEDITAFISDRIDVHAQDLAPVTNKDVQSLVAEISRKAEGVFLWVRLVLNALEDGMLNGDQCREPLHPLY